MSSTRQKSCSRQIMADLREHEGCRYSIYLDHLGYPTCGVGHLITEDDKDLHGKPVGTPVTEKQVEYMLIRDYGIAYSDARHFVGPAFWENLDGQIKRVIVNMSFQLGAARLRKFVKFKQALLDCNMDRMVAEMEDSRWAKQTPNRVKALIKILRDMEAAKHAQSSPTLGYTGA